VFLACLLLSLSRTEFRIKSHQADERVAILIPLARKVNAISDVFKGNVTNETFPHFHSPCNTNAAQKYGDCHCELRNISTCAERNAAAAPGLFCRLASASNRSMLICRLSRSAAVAFTSIRA
jgi:hypothetical protein